MLVQSSPESRRNAGLPRSAGLHGESAVEPSLTLTPLTWSTRRTEGSARMSTTHTTTRNPGASGVSPAKHARVRRKPVKPPVLGRNSPRLGRLRREHLSRLDRRPRRVAAPKNGKGLEFPSLKREPRSPASSVVLVSGSGVRSDQAARSNNARSRDHDAWANRIAGSRGRGGKSRHAARHSGVRAVRPCKARCLTATSVGSQAGGGRRTPDGPRPAHDSETFVVVMSQKDRAW